ncbi:riboflavin synthase [Alkalihalobacillus sp. 1P02AB]|uniref:riboflavin synthase n=1 Tax=Alkalihalobacillus sp. 1P02AB TaxID=3132260 RepID=UPI0039A646B5
MFTGIVEEIGEIATVKQNGEAIVMKINARKVLADVHLGDSISVNGVCLTVTEFNHQSFSVDMMPETVRATSLNGLNRGSKVNLERAMKADGRFGGHIVSGHVDGIGKIISKQREHNAIYYQVQVKESLTDYMVYKGSITVDGISLTLFRVDTDRFTISIIPHTLEETILGTKEVGDIVNIECDILGKYIEKMLNKQKSPHPKQDTMTSQFLEENGFK